MTGKALRTLAAMTIRAVVAAFRFIAAVQATWAALLARLSRMFGPASVASCGSPTRIGRACSSSGFATRVARRQPSTFRPPGAISFCVLQVVRPPDCHSGRFWKPPRNTKRL